MTKINKSGHNSAFQGHLGSPPLKGGFPKGRYGLDGSNSQMTEKPGEQIAELAWRIRRLCPDHRDPQRFHEEKSEIAHELSKLARRVS